MVRENDPTRQKWGNSEDEGVENRFCTGSLLQMDTKDVEPSNATLPRRGKDLIEKECLNPSDSPKGCSARAEVVMERGIYSPNSPQLYAYCSCNVSTMTNVSKEDCCHHACCEELAKGKNWQRNG